MMRRVLSFISVGLCLASFTFVGESLAQEDELIINHYVEEVATTDAQLLKIHGNVQVFGDEPLPPLPPPPPPISDDLVVVDQIINIAKQIWQVIVDNQATLNVKYQYANALPHGVRGGEDLQGWSPLQYKTFHAYGENLFGTRVYDVHYSIVHQYGGNFNGKGKYLETVTVLPQEVNVLWGYTVNLDVTKVTVTNIGSHEEPLASLIMEMALRVGTVLQKSEARGLFEFRGDSPDVKSHGAL